mgnify:CR=1 FL=1
MEPRNKTRKVSNNKVRQEVRNSIAVLIMAVIALICVILVMLWIPVP